MVALDDPKVRAAFDEAPLPRMSFGDHLDELRKRLWRSLIAVFVCVLGVLPFKFEVQAIILEPYHVQWRVGFRNWVAGLEAKEKAGAFVGEQADKLGRGFLENCRTYFDTILAGTFGYPDQLPALTGYPVPYNLFAIRGLDDIFSFMFASLVFALVLASPVVVWQAWAFVAAGLYEKERRLFYRYFPFMVLLLVGGVLFGYWIALPYSLGFLIGIMNPGQVGPMFGVGDFLTLLFAMTAAMGLVFQLPLVMVALQRVGLVTHRAFVKNWRFTVLVMFIAAAVFTPPDPVSMMLMAAPMLVLYGLGLVLTRIGRRHEAKLIEVAP